MVRRFNKVLVANRGEIAVRIIRGAQRQGCRTVAVYSEADRDALHVRLADEAVCIGPPPAAQSYLSIGAIIAAARSSGAQAVHPGYGFLSERADFASAVQSAGLTFIGPNPASIEAMGNKSASKARMLAAGVPCIPGYQGEDQSDAILRVEALKVGLPVMIKAAAGGGGRGMRLVKVAATLDADICSARSEAENAFGSGQLLVEKAVIGGRHVEIQIFGDSRGNVVHLGERDCSIQRRNQKVVEETPSPVVDEALRLKMGTAAVAAAKAVDYVGAGTVEFMLDADGEQFYFLEMNTRLQVEHAITEAVYDVDLVGWQLRIAQGEALPLSQDEILARRHGHAIEVRLCTEDPAQDYLPQTGCVLRWKAPDTEGLRTDTWLTSGTVISPYYDSMQAKLVACGETREVARARLVQALEATELLGVASNRDYLRAILCSDDYVQGEFSTAFISTHLETLCPAGASPPARHWMLAALVLTVDDGCRLAQASGIDAELRGWSSVQEVPERLRLKWRDTTQFASVATRNGHEFRLTCAGETLVVDVLDRTVEVLRIRRHDGCEFALRYARSGDALWVDDGTAVECYLDLSYAPVEARDAGSDGRVLARSDGRIVVVHANVGDVVEKGETLLVLEAMKMEFQVVAPIAGTVESLDVSGGTQVKGRQLLAQIRAAVPEDSATR